MNRSNVQATLDILQLAQNFDINDFQIRSGTQHKYANTIEELHVCGNTACIAGYVGLSPAWREFGGEIKYGIPHLKGQSTFGTEEAMAAFWGVDTHTAGAIIYGDAFTYFTKDLRITGMPHCWGDMNKEQAISLFEQLLALDEKGVAL